MVKKIFFLFTATLFLCSIYVQAQVELVPLMQYSVGQQSSGAMYRTTSLAADPQDTLIALKLPYIEDFSGNIIPIDTITYVLYSAPDSVYQLTHLKMHALKSGDPINVFNIHGLTGILTAPLTGIKYAKVLDVYTFQLFDDAALSIPTPVGSIKMILCTWTRVNNFGYSTYPDTLGFWPNNGGTFINDDMAINPVSVGAATFDGLNYLGIPYAITNTKGYADNLTSHRFDLSSYTAADSIYMSFYYQYKSWGDSPLNTEFLSLELNTKGIDTTGWVEVWRQYGNPDDPLDTFRVAMIPILGDSLLHKNFRYRFRSYGVLNGRFNVWNLDYIFIDTGRTYTNPLTTDITLVSTTKNCLANYTAIPYNHFNSPGVTASSLTTTNSIFSVRNLISAVASDTSYLTFYLRTRDNLGNAIAYDNTAFLPQSNRYTASIPTTVNASLMTAPYVLKQEYYIQEYFDTLSGYDLSFNNFKAVETAFYDFYSYDDGTPEFALKTDESGLSLVNRFTILKADSVTDIDICFVRSNGPDLTGRQIYLQVWSVNPLKLIGNQLISIAYSPIINGVVRYHLYQNHNLAPGGNYNLTAGDYYFGYQQKFNDILTVGYDRDNDHLGDIYLNTVGSATWSPFTDKTSLTGSLMIRPVFDKGETITAIEDPSYEAKSFEIFPNPNKGELHFTGEPEYISIFDISGKLIYEKSLLNETSIFLPASISNGLYIAILSKNDISETKRLIIQQ